MSSWPHGLAAASSSSSAPRVRRTALSWRPASVRYSAPCLATSGSNWSSGDACGAEPEFQLSVTVDLPRRVAGALVVAGQQVAEVAGAHEAGRARTRWQVVAQHAADLLRRLLG